MEVQRQGQRMLEITTRIQELDITIEMFAEQEREARASKTESSRERNDLVKELSQLTDSIVKERGNAR